ncbi:hypothetical protein KC19_11G027100 [Ceratodon purpureus]|uniref:Protein kinase domain-containing protein n=1 Tax=Ceratodon purpureus TaxID=3225 RepID=A0A8T0GFZ9_CERPU|nr:hypothetical protein KC19_11G027100 [Ceratodon purpureus]
MNRVFFSCLLQLISLSPGLSEIQSGGYVERNNSRVPMAEEHVNSVGGDLADTNDVTRSFIEEETATMMTTGSCSAYIAKEELSNTSSKGAIGCEALPGPAPPCTEYFSTCIQSIMESRSESGSTLESEIEASKEHWSEVWSEGSSDDEERIGERNLVLYESLKIAKGFFKDWNDDFHKLGEKIAEGGQAEIYKLEFLDPRFSHEQAVLKVFKLGFRLQALQKQWPDGMLVKVKDIEKPYFAIEGCSGILNGMMLKDGRFAFMMIRFWGDLWKLIDCRMESNGNKAPPFTDVTAFKTMFYIAKAMRELHKNNILHRDLKPGNVLIWPHKWTRSPRIDEDLEHSFDSSKDDNFQPVVTDFECSCGVLGTGIWRAPEILVGLGKQQVSGVPTKESDVSSLFTKKSDVYSYAMTCYEILTGKTPFRKIDYDAILQGTRPTLPRGLEPLIGKLLQRCWHHEPSMRPSFDQIVKAFNHHGYT